MTIGQLRTFLAVVASGSVRGASEQLVVSQPAVSAALAALQKEIGVALVERRGRGLSVTPAGAVFADYVRRSLGLLDAGVVAATSAAEPDRGRLRLAAVTTAGERVVPPLLAALRSRHPGIELTLEVGNRMWVWQRLINHEVDLVVAGRPVDSAAVVTLATRPYELVLVAARKGLARVRSVRPDVLAEATWLVREPGSGSRAAVQQFLRSADIDPPILTLGSNGAIREGVQIGLGITLVARDTVAAELADGTLEEWRCPPLPLQREWHVAAAAGTPLTSPAQLFVDQLVEDGWELRAAREPDNS